MPTTCMQPLESTTTEMERTAVQGRRPFEKTAVDAITDLPVEQGDRSQFGVLIHPIATASGSRSNLKCWRVYYRTDGMPSEGFDYMKLGSPSDSDYWRLGWKLTTE